MSNCFNDFTAFILLFYIYQVSAILLRDCRLHILSTLLVVHCVKLRNEFSGSNFDFLCYIILDKNKSGNHVVLMIRFTKFRAGIRTKHVRR